MRVLLFLIFSLFINANISAQAGINSDFVENIAPFELRVYPNPTTDSFSVVDNTIVDEVVLFNIIGRKVKTFKHERNKKYSLIDLPDGMYFISLVSQSEGVLKTLRINKRMLRP